MQDVFPEDLTRRTIAHYAGGPQWFWEGTKDHDVSQNVQALLSALPGQGPFRILDLGCGPGRDLMTFRELGHDPVGLDGCAAFVAMARDMAGCDVWHQDFISLDLPPEHFHGVFANASLFHVPRAELPRVLRELWTTLVPGGVLFSSNPRGPQVEQVNGERYGFYCELPVWRDYCEGAGFREVHHYYRPPGRPREEQPWLASVWRKGGVFPPPKGEGQGEGS